MRAEGLASQPSPSFGAVVMPAQAGIHDTGRQDLPKLAWIPACAGMTGLTKTASAT